MKFHFVLAGLILISSASFAGDTQRVRTARNAAQKRSLFQRSTAKRARTAKAKSNPVKAPLRSPRASSQGR